MSAKRWTFLTLISALALLAQTGCEKPQPKPMPSPRVTVSTPVMATVTNWDEYPGHVEAVEMVDVRPRVSGYLESIHFDDGAQVKAGDLLFVIDPKPYQADLDRAKAQRQQAETRLDLVRNDFKRAEILKGTKAISEEEYDSRSKAVREAESTLAAAQAAEASAQLNLSYTRITAPISGKIGRRQITPGNLVQLQAASGASTLLATIVSMDPIYCYFDVEEGAFLKYRRNARTAELSTAKDPVTACELGLVNETGFAHQGRLDFFDNAVNPQTGTIRLRAVFANTDGALVPGMFANVRVPAQPPGPAMLVPDVAVMSDQGYKYVFVANQTNGVEARMIQVGPASGTLRTVLKGLTPEDRVIVNGLIMLRPGIKVDPEGQAEASAQKAKAQNPESK